MQRPALQSAPKIDQRVQITVLRTAPQTGLRAAQQPDQVQFSLSYWLGSKSNLKEVSAICRRVSSKAPSSARCGGSGATRLAKPGDCKLDWSRRGSTVKSRSVRTRNAWKQPSSWKFSHFRSFSLPTWVTDNCGTRPASSRQTNSEESIY